MKSNKVLGRSIRAIGIGEEIAEFEKTDTGSSFVDGTVNGLRIAQRILSGDYTNLKCLKHGYTDTSGTPLFSTTSEHSQLK